MSEVELIEKDAVVDGVRIHYVARPGRGTPVLLLHGVTSSHETYLPVIPQIDPGVHVYAIDLRGHGRSSHPGRYRVIDYAGDVTAFIEQVIDAPCVLVGHSLGGMVTGYLAAQERPALLGAFLEDAPLTLPREQDVEESAHLMILAELREPLKRHQEAGGSEDDLVDLLTHYTIQTGPHAGKTNQEVWGDFDVAMWAHQLQTLDPAVLDALSSGRQLEGFEPEAFLPQIRCPLHLVAGQPAHGGVLSTEDVEYLRGQVPHMTYSVLEGAGHSLKYDDEDWYLEELNGFLARL